MGITDDFTGAETTAEAKAKLEAILTAYGYDPSTYSTWGDARGDLNTALGLAGSIGVNEVASSFISKLNSLNSDTDAEAYIAAVEAEDGQALEQGVRGAYTAFVIGCKFDGIWDAIKASCILAGARTLSGALVPLAGTAPNNNGPFESSDYNRITGLVGDGLQKYLDTNRNNNADPQDDNHNAFFATVLPSITHRTMGAGADDTGNNLISGDPSNFLFRNRKINSFALERYNNEAGLIGHSRSSSSAFTVRIAEGNNVASLSSETPRDANIHLFGSSGVYSDARLSFYSIGESLDLSLLDNRVSNLMTAISGALS